MRNLRRFYAVAIAIAMLVGMLAPAAVFAADTKSDPTADAKLLYDLKLYKGLSDTEYQPDLSSTLNRQTAATMVLRLFGKEADALKMDEKEAKSILSKKFKDADKVATWAVKQVAYATDNGIISGFPDKTFQPEGMLTGRQYCTLVLKSLDYSDFTFETAGKKFAEIAGLSSADQTAFDATGAIKKEVLVSISRKALDTKPEGSQNTLLQELVTGGTLKVEEVQKVIPDFKLPATTTTSTAPNTTPTVSPTATSTVTGAVYGGVAAVNDLPVGNLITGSTLNKVFKFTVTAPTSQDMVVTSILAKKYGTTAGDTTDILKVYVVDGDTVLVAGTLNNGEARLNKSITIAKGTTKTLTLAVDIAAGAFASRTVIMGLDSAASIVSTPAVAPFTAALQGGTYSIISASVGAVSGTGNSNQAATTVKVGEINKELGNFTITASNTEDLKLVSLTLTTSGLTASNFDNLYLLDDTQTKIDVKGVTSGTKVTFTFGDKAPLITKSNTKRYYLKGDVMSGVGSTGRFKVDNNYDILAKGQLSGANVTVTLTNTPQNLTTGDITVSAGTPALVDTANVPTKIIATSSQKGLIREWQITSPSEEMNVTQIVVNTTWAGGPAVKQNAVFANFYITDENDNVLAGPVASTAVASEAAVTFSNVNWYIPQGQAKKFQLKATTATDAVNNTAVDAQIALNGVSYTLTTTNSTGNLNSAVCPVFATKALATGGTLTASPDATSVANSKPAGAKNLNVGRWLLTAADDKMKVTKVRISTDACVNLSPAGSLSGYVANMGLYVDGALKGAITASPTSTNYFDLDLTSDPLYIDSGVSKQVEVRADIIQAPSAAVTDYVFNFSASNATVFSNSSNVSVTCGGGNVAAGTLTVTSTGTLALVAPVSSQVVAAKVPYNTDMELVRGKYNATNEDIVLNQIELTAVADTMGITDAIKNIKVYEVVNGVPSTTVLGALASLSAVNGGTTKNIPLTTPLTIPVGGSKTIVVVGQFDKDGVTNGHGVTFSLTATNNSVVTDTKGKGVLSNRDILCTGSAIAGGKQTRTNSSVTVALASDSPNGNGAASSALPMLKFTVKANNSSAFLVSGSAITVVTAGSCTMDLLSAPGRAKLYKIEANGTKTLISSSTTGGACTLVIGDTDGLWSTNGVPAEIETTDGQLGISSGETVTLQLEIDATSLAMPAGGTSGNMSVTLRGLTIYDTQNVTKGNISNLPANTQIIYNGDGSTDPYISGNALKF